MPTGFNSVRTLNLDSLSASCLDKSNSSKTGLSKHESSDPTLLIVEDEEELSLDEDLLLGVPWLLFRWFGTCDALMTLHRFLNVMLVQNMPRKA
jgi:hypothetical protein